MSPIEVASLPYNPRKPLKSWNPYLESFLKVGGDDDHFYRRPVEDPVKGWKAREHLRTYYGFAVPGPEALNVLARRAPIVELGAGTGYWARCLREGGVEVVAYDLFAEDWEYWFGKHDSPRWTEVLQGDVSALDAHPLHTLLLCWPNYSDDFAYDALRRYQGGCVVYVGEGPGGCTANDAFHELLAKEWARTESVAIPQWWGLHDRLEVYEHADPLLRQSWERKRRKR